MTVELIKYANEVGGSAKETAFIAGAPSFSPVPLRPLFFSPDFPPPPPPPPPPLCASYAGYTRSVRRPHLNSIRLVKRTFAACVFALDYEVYYTIGISNLSQFYDLCFQGHALDFPPETLNTAENPNKSKETKPYLDDFNNNFFARSFFLCLSQ